MRTLLRIALAAASAISSALMWRQFILSSEFSPDRQLFLAGAVSSSIAALSLAAWAVVPVLIDWYIAMNQRQRATCATIAIIMVTVLQGTAMLPIGFDLLYDGAWLSLAIYWLPITVIFVFSIAALSSLLSMKDKE